MTTPPYSEHNTTQHGDSHRNSMGGPGSPPTPTPIISHRENDFTLADIQFLAQTFGIDDIEHATTDTTPTRIWIEQRPGTDTSIHHLDDLEERYMDIHRGDYIRAAYQLPDGTERVIWEHRVFDDGEPTTQEPTDALVEAQASNWDSLPALETRAQQYLQNHD